jgi:hypothetical protein
MSLTSRNDNKMKRGSLSRMSQSSSRFLALAAALALSSCSYTNSMIDWATGSLPDDSDQASNTDVPSPSTPNQPVPIAPSPAESNPQPTISAQAAPAPAPALAPAPSAARPAAAAPYAATTFVGQKVQQLRAELAQFQGNIARHQQELASVRQTGAGNASTYYSTIASINARLQTGTTPGNPELVAQWSRAQSTLDQMNSDVAKLNTIANEAASDSAFGNYVLNDVRSAYNLQGGVEADRDQLHQIESLTLGSLTTVDQLLNQLGQEISRQSTYVGSERSNLVTLALAIQNGQLYGPSLTNRSFASAPDTSVANSSGFRPAPPSRATAPASAPTAADSRPLVVIRFDQPDVAYEQPLYTAVSRALERKPGATFTIMAVAPNAGSAAQVAVNTNASRQNAENVLRSLTNMGLPADRVSLSATMSPDIQSNEVRVFVR